MDVASRSKAFVVMAALVAVATYSEFVYSGSPSMFSLVLWIIAVPLLLSTTVTGIRDRLFYQPVSYIAFIAIGILQYLDGNWVLLAGLFVLAGSAGLVSEMRNRTSSTLS